LKGGDLKEEAGKSLRKRGNASSKTRNLGRSQTRGLVFLKRARAHSASKGSNSPKINKA